MSEVLTADTSLIIAAVSSWHPRHDDARGVAGRITHLPDHCLIEAYSVLTRLPAPHRLSPAVAGAAVAALPVELVGLPLPARVSLVKRLSDAGVRGGAVYDGLVAETARHHGLTLVTLDVRARSTYEAIGANWRAL